MRVLVIGAAGMLGRKLVERLARDALLGAERVSEMVLVDVVPVQSAEAGEVGVETLVAEHRRAGSRRGFAVWAP
jgi:nucleoside-diphosphate-sugar epimerase